MGQDKLRRFAAIKTFSNVVEPISGEPFVLKGKWNAHFFKNQNPIVIELGCGKGEYSVGMAKMFPEKNFIGVDLKGNRIYIGAKEALAIPLENVGFLRTRIDFIEQFFGPEEIDEIWLTFSDPQPNKPRKRLTSPLFINRYKKFLKHGGKIHVKTDSDVFFDSTLEQIAENNYELIDCKPNLYESLSDEDEKMQAIFSIKTYYENFFSAKGHVIKYVCFRPI